MKGALLVAAHAVLVASFVTHSHAARASELDAALALCDETLQTAPEHPRAYRCYWIVARQYAAWPQAIAHVESLLEKSPEDHRVRLSLALLEADLGNLERSFPLFEQALEGFARERDARGEVYARHNWAYVLISRGDFEGASKLLDVGERVADRSGDDMLRAAIYVEQAYLAQRRGDVGKSWDLFRVAESHLIEGQPTESFLQSRIMTGLARTARATARYRVAMEIFQERAELLRRVGNPFDESFARLNAARMAERLWREGQLSRERVKELCRIALNLAVRSSNELATAEARLLYASFLPESEARAELDRALSFGTFWGERAFLARVYRRLSRHAREHEDPALPFARRSLEAARGSGNPVEIAAALVELAEVQWTLAKDPRRNGVAQWDRAIEAVENVRNLQPDDNVRARFLADWSFVYYRLASLHLEGYRAHDDPRFLDRAFTTAERLRSRVLLDRLDAAGAAPKLRGDESLARQRDEVLSRIVAVQRKLLAPELTTGDRRALLGRLEKLERMERDLRARLVRLDPSTAVLREPSFPSLEELESSLRRDEAVLSFHLPAMRSPDGDLPEAWLQVSTRDGTTVFELPSHEVIDPAVDLFLGLVKRRDGSDELGARRLYQLLMAEALESLPPEVARLVLVPDGKLHELPFAALHDGEAPIVTRYEISVAPSVTSVLRWRERRGLVRPASALVLVDPTAPTLASSRGVMQDGDGDRAWALTTGARLPALPHAREEGRAIASLLGSDVLLLEGDDASEHYVKSANLSKYSVVHFAAHGVVDDTNPDRSAILLAPGTADEDGLLQLRDIVELDFTGKLVVLSACRSASGELVRGEGVLGLGRAFFQSGAHGVVGGLWPLDDREASVAFETFYRHLGSKAGVSKALRASQLELLSAGAATATWAGIVALGDGGLVPMEPHSSYGLPWWLVLAAVLSTVLVLLRRRPRARA